MSVPAGSRLGRAAVAGWAAVGLALAGCSSGAESGDGAALVVWSLENQTDRVRAAQAASDRFTAQTGIAVQVVATDENQFTQLVTSAAAAGELPDVIGALPVAPVWQMAASDLVDREAAAGVIEALGAETFAARSLELTRDGDQQLAIPSDAWPMLLVYRKDLFDAAGLAPPETFERIRQAAQRLAGPGMAGITMATVPDESFTAQTFEHLALGNGCELVDDAGRVSLDSPSCVEAFAFYQDLVRGYSVAGAQGVESTRATYFAGQAAMMVWSSFILDELAGLRSDAVPSCSRCAADPAFLARNSGFVTAVRGPGGVEPAGFADVTSWVIPSGGPNTEAAQRYVQFMMDDGYLDWLAVAPEGKFPARTGTSAEPQRFLEGWSALPAGVDTKRPLGEVYTADVVDALRASPATVRRWGIAQGEGELVGAALGELAVPRALNALVTGQTDPAGAARQATDAITSIQASLG